MTVSLLVVLLAVQLTIATLAEPFTLDSVPAWPSASSRGRATN